MVSMFPENQKTECVELSGITTKKKIYAEPSLLDAVDAVKKAAQN